MPCCFVCGREGIPLFDVGCVNPEVKACAKCIAKHGGPAALKDAADEALQYLFTPEGKRFLLGQSPVCRHCGGPVLCDGEGRAPLMCRKCIAELAALQASA